jgi:autotransporter-associated beta strand protein
VAFSALLLAPSLSSAQSILLTANDFVLLGGTAVTVAGAGPDVFSNGNVGSAASISGFPPATVVNGSTILGGPVVAQALLDLGTARNGLTAMATTTNLTGQDLSGMTLTPGVYKYDVAASITLAGTKTLTLDAQGKNNVVWVFNIGTSLTTAAGAQIQFINLGSNGGKDNGLFWNAGTTITFGATNVIAGNYLAGTDITFGTTVPATGSGSGRALAAAIVSFDGSGTMDALGAPGGGDLTGGLTLVGGVATSSGYVLLSASGSYVVGGSSPVTLTPGTLFNTANATISGNSADAGLTPATLTVFETIATLTGTNSYTGGTIVDSGTLTTGSANLPTNGSVSLIDSNATGTPGVLIFNQSAAGTYGGVISGTGSVTKVNTGTLTLTGTNTYTGATTVSAGTLQIGDGTTDGSIATSSAITNNAAVVFNLVGNQTTAQVISGTGTLTKTGAGTLTLTGANTYTGGTNLGAGTVAFTTGGLGNSGPVAFTGNATLQYGAATTTDLSSRLAIGNGVTGTVDTNGNAVTFANDFGAASTGGFTKVGSGTLTLTGDKTYTGATTVNGGTLQIGDGTTDGSIAASSAITNNAAVVFNLVGNQTTAQVISGTGSLTKTGAGTLTLNGANTYTGGTLLNAGALALQGGSIGTTTVASNAFLRGNGSVSGNLINNGTVSPGFSPGLILVAGNFTQGAGGTLVMEFASATSFDQLLIGGTANLDGTLQLDTLGGFNPAGQSFTLLTATGGVSGAFTAITGSAAVTANVAHNPNNVIVSFTQTAFTSFALTPNQTAVAAAAQNVPALTAALNLVPLASQMPAALNALSPQGYEIWSDLAFAHARSLSDRLGHDRGAIVGHDNYYFEVGQSHNRIKGDADVSPSHFDSDSGLVGGDHALSNTITVGAFLEYTESNADLGSAGSHSTVKNIMPGLRALWKQDGWFANASAAYGFAQYESTRVISFPGTAASAESSNRGQQWMADVTAGHRFTLGPVMVSPFAGLLASGWKAKGFTESGAGVFNATVRDQSARALSTQAGLEGSINLPLGTVVVSPRLRGAWIHELANDARSMDAAFGSVDYTISTRKPQIDSARLSAGLDVSITPRLALFGDYSLQTGDATRVIGAWSAGLAYGF